MAGPDTNGQEGMVKLRWKRVRGAGSYVVQCSPDPINGNTWTQAALVTASRCTVSGLESGVKYWFRVAAIGAAGEGAWSDPAIKRTL